MTGQGQQPATICCFVAGKVIVSRLILVSPLFRLADHLARELHTDNDELLYQSARKLVIIEMQNIVYKEFLPTLLGMTLTKLASLIMTTLNAPAH